MEQGIKKNKNKTRKKNSKEKQKANENKKNKGSKKMKTNKKVKTRSRGQIYLIIAAMIILAVASLADISLHSSIQVEQKQTQASNIGEMALNLKIELSQMQRNNLTDDINDFINIFNNYSSEKNYESSTKQITS